jgi:hypothetical protein
VKYELHPVRVDVIAGDFLEITCHLSLDGDLITSNDLKIKQLHPVEKLLRDLAELHLAPGRASAKAWRKDSFEHLVLTSFTVSAGNDVLVEIDDQGNTVQFLGKETP